MEMSSNPPSTSSNSDGFGDILAPVAGQLSLGSFLGYCSGAALRVAGRVAAVGIGGTFCLIQGLAYQGYIDVNWRRVERDYNRLLDRDQDGQVSASDLKTILAEVTSVLAFNLPGG